MADDVPGAGRPDTARTFEEQRHLLTGVAYRILGSATDAEDVVQEAWLRWANVDPSEVANPRAFLVRVVTRLAIDRLRRTKARRESYVGPWLPEPVVGERDAADDVTLAESVSMAMLIVLETLSPLERAVFVLREAFGMSHAEIAGILGRSEAAVRQLARRARDHVREGGARFETDQETRRQVTERFLEAALGGDVEALMEVLAPGVTLVADGGGRVRAPLRPVHGVDKVARFLVSVATRPGQDARAHIAQVNGGPGIVVNSDGAPVAVLVLDVDGGVARTVYLVANPEKLAGVHGPTTPW